MSQCQCYGVDADTDCVVHGDPKYTKLRDDYEAQFAVLRNENARLAAQCESLSSMLRAYRELYGSLRTPYGR